MDTAGIAASLGRLLSFYGIELFQHLDWDDEVVVLKLVDRLGIVLEDVGVLVKGFNLR